MENRPWWARCDVRWSVLFLPLSFALIAMGFALNNLAGDPRYKKYRGYLHAGISITTVIFVVLGTLQILRRLYSRVAWLNRGRNNTTGSSTELQPISSPAPHESSSTAARQRGPQHDLADRNVDGDDDLAQRPPPPSYEDLERMARSTNDTSFLSCQAAALAHQGQSDQPQQQVVNRTGGNTGSPSTAANVTEVATSSGNVSGLCSARNEASEDERLAPSSARDEASGDERLAPSSTTRDEASGDERLAPSSARDEASGDEGLAPSSTTRDEARGDEGLAPSSARDDASGDERLAPSSARDDASGDERLAPSTSYLEETKF